ncbi:D-threo-aldose 1-dehydrogenase [Thermoflexales bacterium]|nr:D-threo-aldose 1-dehydrogenase [Thermoflexales bacterium]
MMKAHLSCAMTSHTTYATAEGTARYRDRFTDRPGHFRRVQGLWLSSIGLGTYLGETTDGVDRDYAQAIRRAVELGCNVIDTAINYRYQRSERAIGKALKQLLKQHSVQRDELIIATKGGYLPFDHDLPPAGDRYLRETFIDQGLAAPNEIVGGNCLAPRFLRAMLEQSLHNLGLNCIDIYYLHNPESQLSSIGRTEFRERLRAAFDALEEAADEGLIRYYGLATWNGFRVAPTAPDYLSLSDVNALARKVRGMKHRCRFIQLPLNLALPEAVTLHNQVVSHEKMPVLEAAARFGLSVIGSASLWQGRLIDQIAEPVRTKFNDLSTDAQRCLQFARSTPGVTTALAGMSRVAHVEENLATARVPPLTSEEYQALFA